LNPNLPLEIKIDDFGEFDQNKAIDLIVYGITIKTIHKVQKGTVKPCVFALCENNPNHLFCIRRKSKKKNGGVTKIELNDISSISNVKNDESGKNKTSMFDSELILQILYGKNQQLLLIFDDRETKGLFWGGLMYFMDHASQEEEKMYFVCSKKVSLLILIEKIQRRYLQGMFLGKTIKMGIIS